MTEHTIPCETFARLCNVLKYLPRADPWCNSVRLEQNLAIVTNREYLVIERIDNPADEPLHVPADPALIAQCLTEATYHSKLHIAANSMLRYAALKTSMGYQFPGNAGLYLDEPCDLERWRSVIPTTMAKKAKGSMCLEAGALANIALSSPSGRITLPEFVDWSLPVVARDAVDPNWCAFFYVREADQPHEPATIPGWLK